MAKLKSEGALCLFFVSADRIVNTIHKQATKSIGVNSLLFICRMSQKSILIYEEQNKKYIVMY